MEAINLSFLYNLAQWIALHFFYCLNCSENKYDIEAAEGKCYNKCERVLKSIKMLALPKKHISITAAYDITLICKPLFQKTEIDYFAYGKFYDDGAFYILTSDGGWVPYFASKGYKLTAPMPKYKHVSKSFYLVPLTGEYQQTYADFRNFFQHENVLNYIEIYENYYEMFAFAGALNNNKVIEFYINNVKIKSGLKKRFDIISNFSSVT